MNNDGSDLSSIFAPTMSPLLQARINQLSETGNPSAVSGARESNPFGNSPYSGGGQQFSSLEKAVGGGSGTSGGKSGGPNAGQALAAGSALLKILGLFGGSGGGDAAAGAGGAAALSADDGFLLAGLV